MVPRQRLPQLVQSRTTAGEQREPFFCARGQREGHLAGKDGFLFGPRQCFQEEHQGPTDRPRIPSSSRRQYPRDDPFRNE